VFLHSLEIAEGDLPPLIPYTGHRPERITKPLRRLIAAAQRPSTCTTLPADARTASSWEGHIAGS
jgi:hypothetical protein